jgi:hypothetical protein
LEDKFLTSKLFTLYVSFKRNSLTWY